MEIAEKLIDLERRQKVTDHRLRDLEGEVKDMRQLTTAVVQVNDKVDHLRSTITEIRADVKAIGQRPAVWWDKLVAAAIGAVATGIVGAAVSLLWR